MGEGGFDAAFILKRVAVEMCLPPAERGDGAGLRRGFGAAQTGTDTGDDLCRIKGFDDVVIRAKFQPRDTVLHLCAARDDDHDGPLFQRQTMHQRQLV